MPQLRYSVEQRLFLVSLTSNMSLLQNVAENFSAQETICTKGHKIVRTAACKTTIIHALKEHDPVTRYIFVIGFFSLYNMDKFIHR
jgi:hypothetical protein